MTRFYPTPKLSTKFSSKFQSSDGSDRPRAPHPAETATLW
eukprot:SAG31_NODE_6220_length_2114_cov_1.084367_1_plen_39_part_10